MELQPNCSELTMKLDIKDKKEILKELKKEGITEMEVTSEDYYGAEGDRSKERFLIDKDNPNLPDIENGAYIHLQKDDDKTWEISAHQHCQHQIFPTLKKIQNHFGGRYHSDGGSTEDYEEWDGKPVENYNAWIAVIRKGGDWTDDDIKILEKSKKKWKSFKKVIKMFNIKLSTKNRDRLAQMCVLEEL